MSEQIRVLTQDEVETVCGGVGGWAFQLQSLLSAYNRAETLASSVLKKHDDTISGIIGKI